jgi:hypothetical protein
MDVNMQINRNCWNKEKYKASLKITLKSEYIDFFEGLLLVVQKIRNWGKISYSSSPGPETFNLDIEYNSVDDIIEIFQLFNKYNWYNFRFFTESNKETNLIEIEKEASAIAA